MPSPPDRILLLINFFLLWFCFIPTFVAYKQQENTLYVRQRRIQIGISIQASMHMYASERAHKHTKTLEDTHSHTCTPTYARKHTETYTSTNTHSERKRKRGRELYHSIYHPSFQHPQPAVPPSLSTLP